MKKDISTTLKKLLTDEGVAFSVAEGNVKLLRRYLTHKEVPFSFLEREDQLLAKALALNTEA